VYSTPPRHFASRLTRPFLMRARFSKQTFGALAPHLLMGRPEASLGCSAAPPPFGPRDRRPQVGRWNRFRTSFDGRYPLTEPVLSAPPAAPLPRCLSALSISAALSPAAQVALLAGAFVPLHCPTAESPPSPNSWRHGSTAPSLLWRSLPCYHGSSVRSGFGP